MTLPNHQQSINSHMISTLTMLMYNGYNQTALQPISFKPTLTLNLYQKLQSYYLVIFKYIDKYH